MLLLIGDTGAASPELRANFAAMAREPALLVLHAGDIGYRGPREYGRFLAAAEALPVADLRRPRRSRSRRRARLRRRGTILFGGRNRVVEKDGLRIVLLDTRRRHRVGGVVPFPR